MGIDTSYNNLFRYIHFKPARRTELLEEITKKQLCRPDISKSVSNIATKDKQKSLPDKKSLLITLKKIESLDLTRDVNLNGFKDTDGENTFLTLNENGLAKLSGQPTDVLKSIGLDPLNMTQVQIINELNSVLAEPQSNNLQFIPLEQQPNDLLGNIQAVGIANLHVVKQQIKRYEATEIAHIENVLAGEKKVRTHNQLTRSEDFFSSITERTTDTETELETTERFELNKQSSNTFQKDTELGLELTLSGKYGPSISFESNFNAGQTTSDSESNEQSINFAKDTIERSKERIVEKIATEQQRTLIKEISETNEHILENSQSEHKFAIYQYVDKIYESQVFDYGKRQMFDFMIPEPSSYLWYLKKTTELKLDLEEPKSLNKKGIHDSRDISKNNYLSLGAIYGINDLPTPPELFTTKRIRLAHGTGEVNDSGVHKSGVSGEISIPKGYSPLQADVAILATSDENLHFSINIGGTIVHYKKDQFTETSVGGGHKKYSLTINNEVTIAAPIPRNILAPDEKLYIDIYGYQSANYTIHIDILFNATYDHSIQEYSLVYSWKQKVYEKLAEAYQNSILQYRQELSFLEAEAEAQDRNKIDFGAPPAVNKKLILTELKKHCLAIIRKEHVGTLVTTHSGQPPQFDIVEAREDGEIIRFLEHAFEWGQMQYVFYPYFWARPENEQEESDQSGWSDRFLAKNIDYTMEEFLKAGYARVVVPVREGFHAAVSFFIENGQVYDGLGEPDINDPLYISIIDEIKERTGAGKDEIPVGDPWETRLPTAAVLVRKSDTLPKWVKQEGEDWVWVPENNAS